MAKKNQGQINFFRFMALIGVVVIGGIGYGFMGAAPNLNNSDYHVNTTTSQECLQCHERNVENTPIMPHRPMGSCTFCHRKAG
jgi:hypothetical protein